MMIKSNGEYFDFDGRIEIESRIKLFESIDQSAGDFSYDIELPDTSKNRKMLGIPVSDSIKAIYTNVPADVINNSGELVRSGKLQVVGIGSGIITVVFYAGNTDWFGQLSEPMANLPLYKYDIEFTEANIMASWTNTTGIIFPIIDTGVLVSRSFHSLKVEDFTSCFYVKTLMKEIFNPLGIKLQGDFIDDPIYDKIGICSNGRSEEEVTTRSSYVNKTADQNISSLTQITFQDDFTYPFFDGSQNNFQSSSYTADVKLRVRIEINLLFTAVAVFSTTVRVNGVTVKSYSAGGISAPDSLSKTITLDLEAGDILTVSANPTLPMDVLEGSTIKITPTYIYKVFGNSSVPNWTQGEFVSNVFRIFNVLPSYDPVSKTLTVDLFNKIKEKPYIDISDQIEIQSIDFSELVSDYGVNNYLKYQESDDEDLRQYNISNFISYGSGNITVDNDFIDNSSDIVESDFTSPITYLSGVFDMSMERIKFVELSEIDDKEITSVTDSSGVPRFQISNADNLFKVGDLVRLETESDSYNGEWVINAVTSSYITVIGGVYDNNSSGSATLLKHEFTTDSNVYLFIVVPSVANTFFSSKTPMYLEESDTFTSASIAYFNLLANNRLINKIWKQSLSFGTINDPLSYQLTIVDTYWPVLKRILNDPVMLRGLGYFDKITYDQLVTFLRPLMVKTNETTNLYYLNRLIGYESGHEPCDVELIKL